MFTHSRYTFIKCWHVSKLYQLDCSYLTTRLLDMKLYESQKTHIGVLTSLKSLSMLLRETLVMSKEQTLKNVNITTYRSVLKRFHKKSSWLGRFFFFEVFALFFLDWFFTLLRCISFGWRGGRSRYWGSKWRRRKQWRVTRWRRWGSWLKQTSVQNNKDKIYKQN